MNPPKQNLTFTTGQLAKYRDKLSPKHRLVLFEATGDKSYKQMAAVLGLPEGTIRSRLCRAREAMNAILAKENAP